MFVVTVILAVLLALAFAASGSQKLTGAKMMTEGAAHLGLPYSRYRLIGVLEVLAAIALIVGLWVAPLGIAAAVGLVLLMIGAVIFHLRAGDKIKEFGPALMLGILALLEVIFRAASA
jgi:uncharacterized membrane protein YphA (DoxX/SURF4 family)